MPESDGSLGSTDIAILSARADCARFGASRWGFYPEDIEGSGGTEPGEYIWKEYFPPTTQWTLLTEGRVCGYRPVAAFSNTSCPSVGEVVMFTDESTPALWVTFWYWDFGDGSSSNDQNPTHQYAAAGNYTVTLYVSGPKGTASTTGTVVVMEVVASVDDDTLALDQVVTATATITGGAAPFTYLWSFDDGLPTLNQTDLYGHWTLNETEGNDRVRGAGIGPDLVETGGTVPEVAGRFTNAASSTEADAFGLSAALAPAFAVSAGFTVAFWFNWGDVTDGKPQAMLDLDNGAGVGTPPIFEVARYFDSEYLEVFFYWAAAPDYVALPSPRLGPFDKNEWHLFVATYDATTGVFTGMVDDGCFASATVWTGLPLPADKLSATVPPASLAAANASTFNRLMLLKAPNANYVNFEGAIDDLRIWTRVLTADEIADLWYRSDEESPQYAYGSGGGQTISVTVTDSGGCTATDTETVVVGGV